MKDFGEQSNTSNKFKDENIRIIIFEGYGQSDYEYIESVNKLGYQIYKDKFSPIKTLLNYETYNKVMKSIDILIIDVTHQTGLAAIYSTAFFGGNVYLTKNGRNKEFMDELGITTFLTEDIINATRLDDLLKIKEDQKNKNLMIVQKRRKSTENKKDWYEFLYGEKKCNDTDHIS